MKLLSMQINPCCLYLETDINQIRDCVQISPPIHYIVHYMGCHLACSAVQIQRSDLIYYIVHYVITHNEL